MRRQIDIVTKIHCKILALIYFETGSPQNECYTVSGPGANKPCMFPFRFNGVNYNTCTLDSAEENKPWCSTRVDGNNNHVPGGGHYGNCGPKCPLPDICNTQDCPTNPTSKFQH